VLSDGEPQATTSAGSVRSRGRSMMMAGLVGRYAKVHVQALTNSVLPTNFAPVCDERKRSTCETLNRSLYETPARA
jgi:hypothetical protein